jgi:hypothetical protein
MGSSGGIIKEITFDLCQADPASGFTEVEKSGVVFTEII